MSPPLLRYKGCKRGFWLLLPASTVQTEETGAWQHSSVHVDRLLFPGDVKLFTAPANKIRITAVLSCHQCRKVQPLLPELWLLSICSVGSVEARAGLLHAVRAQGAQWVQSCAALLLCSSLLHSQPSLLLLCTESSTAAGQTCLENSWQPLYILFAGGDKGTCTQKKKKGDK